MGGNGDYSGLLLCGKAVSKLSGVLIKTRQLVNKINTQIVLDESWWHHNKSTSDL